MESVSELSITVNGQTRIPPGFRFHPTEEELLNYYLRKKVACEKIDLDVIRDVDLNKLEPWDIQEKCKMGSTPQNDWYLFSHRDKKYPSGTRTNRATAAGFWKATGRDKVIHTGLKQIGMRKTLVFYKGRAPHGQKSDWIMHEYRLDELQDSCCDPVLNCSEAAALTREEGWVVCRVFRKKSHQKSLDSPSNSSSVTSGKTRMTHSINDGTLEQIVRYVGRPCKRENDSSNATNPANNIDSHFNHQFPFDTGLMDKFMKFPALENPLLNDGAFVEHMEACVNGGVTTTSSDWASLELLVASQLHSQSDVRGRFDCFGDPHYGAFCCSNAAENSTGYTHEDDDPGVGNADMDLWAFAAASTTSSGSHNV